MNKVTSGVKQHLVFVLDHIDPLIVFVLVTFMDESTTPSLSPEQCYHGSGLG